MSKCTRWLWGHKDGGPESEVRCWGLEIKGLLSIMVLRFNNHSREVYHNHAFNCISWVLSGALHEDTIQDAPGGTIHTYRTYRAGFTPVLTYKDTMHQVRGSRRPNWVLTFRGPWADTWQEESLSGETTSLTHGREIINATD